MADLIVALHFAFVLFVVLGGLLVLRWPRLIWLHVPAVAWGVLIEFAGWICPLTPLENRLRAQQGEARYEGDFIARYILPVLYPEGLTRRDQWLLGGIALAVNLAVYAWIFLKHRRPSGDHISSDIRRRERLGAMEPRKRAARSGARGPRDQK
jgi:Protein of Unknown function (DUF2784)